MDNGNATDHPGEICPISGQTSVEELWNVLTHFVGLWASLIGLGFLVYSGSATAGVTMSGASLVYGTSLVMLYGASVAYHSWPPLPNAKRWLQIADHSAIYLLIAGTFTPFALGPLQSTGSMLILITVWLIAIAGIVGKFFKVGSGWMSAIIFLVVPWGMGTALLGPLGSNLTTFEFGMLFGGGIAYSGGVIFYLWETLPFNHMIWHLFVLTGSALHYFSVSSVAGYL